MHIDYLQPYKTDYVCFLVKIPPPNPKWKDMIIPFQKELWLAILVSLALCVVVESILNGFLVPDAFMNIVAIFLDYSLPVSGKPK